MILRAGKFTSMPVRSISSNGPMRKPQASRITASTWLTEARPSWKMRRPSVPLAVRRHGVDHPLRRVGGADDLDQLHQRHRVEVVHAADAVAVLERARDR